MKTVCKLNNCTGCNACVNTCPHEAITIVDRMRNLNAVIDESKCINCRLCYNKCPNNFPVQKHPPLFWKQGWACDTDIRARGSSGGVASAIIDAFVRNEGIVCSCVFLDGEFKFLCTDNLYQINRFSGSKYVKSDTKGIFVEIQSHLFDGKSVLFVGLPCQVAAVYSFIPNHLHEKLYTVELVCHGTPSKLLFEHFLRQSRITLSELTTVQFRQKTNMGLNIRKAHILPGTTDCYLISFKMALNLTENCYNCSYASLDRVSDIVLGDSWGTELSSELKLGVSLLGCQTAKGEYLLRIASLELRDVDIDHAISYNESLIHPHKVPINRERFFDELDQGKSYKKLILKYYPKQCMRQFLKAVATGLGIRKQ